MYWEPCASADGVGCTEGESNEQVSEKWRRAERACCVGQGRWPPCVYEDSAKFFRCSISSACSCGESAGSVQFIRPHKHLAEQSHAGG